MKLEEAINILRNFKLDMRQPNAFRMIEAIGIVENIFKEIQQYREIGTVEECREGVEKQKPKNPKLRYKPRFLGKTMYTCPKCGNCCLEEFANERQRNNYCWDCGQKLNWDENLEEIEDECK